MDVQEQLVWDINMYRMYCGMLRTATPEQRPLLESLAGRFRRLIDSDLEFIRHADILPGFTGRNNKSASSDSFPHS